MLHYASVLILVSSLPLTATQSSFQCGDGNYSFVPSENGRDCTCSPDSFLAFVNMGCPIPSSPEQNNETIFLGGVIDLTGFDWAVDIFQVTVDLYNQGFFVNNNESSINNRVLTYDLADSKCDETEAIRAYWRIRTDNGGIPPEGVVGTRCSGASESLARVTGVEGVPQVSPSATSGKLSDNERYPGFSRVVGPQNGTSCS
jgi:Receptor family ligand binding region